MTSVNIIGLLIKTFSPHDSQAVTWPFDSRHQKTPKKIRLDNCSCMPIFGVEGVSATGRQPFVRAEFHVIQKIGAGIRPVKWANMMGF